MKRKIKSTSGKVPYVRPKRYDSEQIIKPTESNFKGLMVGDPEEGKKKYEPSEKDIAFKKEFEKKNKRVISKYEARMRSRMASGKKQKYFLTGVSFNRINSLKKEGVTFKVHITNRTVKIVTKDADYMYFPDVYSFKELNLQRLLKEQFRKNIEAKKIKVKSLTQSDVNYYSISDFIKNYPVDKKFPKSVEFDIDKAYYQCAYNDGYIDKDFYEMCIGLKKKIRLRLIGSIATHKRIYDYVNGRLKEIVPKKDDLLRNCWFGICKKVDDCMIEFKKKVGDDFLFYWVDGIYVKQGKDFSKIVSDLQNKYGFTFKKVPIDKIEKESKKEVGGGEYQIVNVFKEGKPKPKPFSLEKDDVDLFAKTTI